MNNNKKITLGLIIIMIIAIVAGVLLLTKGGPLTIFKKAEETSKCELENESVGFCQWRAPDIFNLNDFVVIVNGITIPADQIRLLDFCQQQGMNCFQAQFDYKPGVKNNCEVKYVDSISGTIVPCGEKSGNCLTPIVEPSETPIEVTVIEPSTEPTREQQMGCEECGDPGIRCEVINSSSVEPTGSGTCPLRIDTYLTFKDPYLTPSVCQQYPILNCDIHQIIIESSDPNDQDRVLSKEECAQVKAGGSGADLGNMKKFILRLDKDDDGENCTTYRVKVVYKDRPNQEVENILACSDCEFQIGCPIIDCTNAVIGPLNYDDLVDIPDLKPEVGAGECNPNNCYLIQASKTCDVKNTKTTFTMQILGNQPTSRLWLDDPYNGGGWIYKSQFRSLGNNEYEYEHLYKDGGYYDIVLECVDGLDPTQHYHCAQRIVKTCRPVETTGVQQTPCPTNYMITPQVEILCPGCACTTLGCQIGSGSDQCQTEYGLDNDFICHPQFQKCYRQSAEDFCWVY